MKVLITGGAGFIGSHFTRVWIKKYPKDFITVLDLLDYAGNEDFLKEIKSRSQVQFVKGDICDKKLVQSLTKNTDAVFHLAAQTHVDRSIQTSDPFVQTNIVGTQNLLESSRQNKVKKFIYISTDEVYGSIAHGKFKEESPLHPSSPYSASKAAGDLLCLAYWHTYQFPVIITRCCNNFGPHQFPEKVIPVFITNLLEGKKIPLYGKGNNVREWIHVLDHCKAIELVFKKGKSGEIYNIGTGKELNNLELANLILKKLNLPSSFIQSVSDRPGHDLRYALDSSKLKKLGFKPDQPFSEYIQETIRWYEVNKAWWKKIKDGNSYQKYSKKQYPTIQGR